MSTDWIMEFNICGHCGRHDSIEIGHEGGGFPFHLYRVDVGGDYGSLLELDDYWRFYQRMSLEGEIRIFMDNPWREVSWEEFQDHVTGWRLTQHQNECRMVRYSHEAKVDEYWRRRKAAPGRWGCYVMISQ